MLVETILVLVFYPLFVLSWQQLIRTGWLAKVIEGTKQTAETHRETIRRYGIPGLFFFVWFPFWMTGPVVGCAIGFLLGLHAWLILFVVLTGTYVAMGGWAILLKELHVRAAEISVLGPLILFAIIILIVLVVYKMNRTSHKRTTDGGPDKRRRS